MEEVENAGRNFSGTTIAIFTVLENYFFGFHDVTEFKFYSFLKVSPVSTGFLLAFRQLKLC